VSRISEIIADEYTEVIDGKRIVVGIQGAASHVIGVRNTYSDLFVTIDRQISEGERVASCIKATGTHKGEWMGIAPTGSQVVFTGVNIDRLIYGKIVEHGGASNMLGPLLELGAIRVVGRE